MLASEHRVQAPLRRGLWRQRLGREWFIAKRRWQWWRSGAVWARRDEAVSTPHLVFQHRSLILRPLQGVDMALQHNKRTNLALAIAHLDGLVIAPGQTFSVWKNVGRPRASKGYQPGLVMVNGRIDSGVGGGLCQLGNLLFWLFAHSPLSITERYRHGYDVFPGVARDVPFGAGATLAYNYVDLQAVNHSVDALRLRLWLDDTHLNGALYSEAPLRGHYRVEERDHRMVQQVWGGYTRHNRIVQVHTDADGGEREAVLAVNHAIMLYPPILAHVPEPENVSGKLKHDV